jgi:hypothetical protein
MEFLLFKLYVGDFPKLHVQNFLLDAKMALNSAGIMKILFWISTLDQG